MKPTIIILSLITTILSSIFPTNFSQNLQYQTCNQPFQCGNIRNIPYPFWGGNRPSYCGASSPNFHLNNCEGATTPFLNISSSLYQVLDINASNQSLRVSRLDLLNDTCPSFPRNTTLLNTPFRFLNDGNVNVTIYYGCTFAGVQVRNRFNCSVNNGTGFYVVGEVPLDPGFNFSCLSNIVVPVSGDVASGLGDSSVGLRDGLSSGFEVRWEGNGTECGSCVRSGGVCGFSQDTSSFACFCADRPYGFVCGGNDLAARSSGGFFNLQGIAIIVSILGFTCVIVPAMILFCRFSKKRGWNKSDKESNKIVEDFILTHGSLAPKRYTYNEIKKATKSFSHKLGQGGFGSVYKGVLPDNRPIAVKILNDTSAKGEEFINEVASISRTSHVNIVNLLGFCYDKNNRALMYEYMPNNSLDKFIYAGGSSNKEQKLEWNKLYEIAVGVARGLEYLHRGCNTRIVHFDIKPQNILLDEDFCPKISDFGLAKLFQNNQSILSSVFGARGTIGYIAPEVFCRNFGAVSYRSDVYSYGMMVLEMAGARKFGETEAKENYNYFPDMIYNQCVACEVQKFDQDNVMSKDEVETMRKMFLIGFWCIQTAPTDRPSMSKVVEMFEGSVDFIHIPPKPFLSSPSSSGPHFFSSFTADFSAETFSEGSLMGQKQTSTEGSLMGQMQTSSEGSLMGKMQTSSEGSLDKL